MILVNDLQINKVHFDLGKMELRSATNYYLSYD